MVYPARMKNRRRRIEQEPPRGISSQLLGLSLFVMMLAFFIILVAISTYEEVKFRPALASIGFTFSSRVISTPNSSPSVIESDEETIEEGDVLERMKALFNAHIPGQKSFISQSTGTLYVRVPLDEFEASIMAVTTDDAEAGEQTKEAAKFMLPMLVGLMKGDRIGLSYRMDMNLNVKGNPGKMQNDKPQELSAHIKKMSNIADRLEYAGLEKKLMSAGVQEGPENTVDLMFLRHAPYNPMGDKLVPR